MVLWACVAPSERSVAVIIGLSCCIFRAQGLSDLQKYNFLKGYKPKIKKMLQGLPNPVEYLTILPKDTTLLPVELRDNAFPGGFVPQAPEGVDLQAFDIAMIRYPLRKTNSLTQEPSVCSSSTAGGTGDEMAWKVVCHVLAAMMGHRDSRQESAREALPSQQTQRPVLALRDGTVEPLETDNRHPEPLDVVRVAVAETLPERRQSHEETNMEAELDQLRQHAAGQEPEADSAPSGVMKRPYARKAPKAKSAAKPMKRPAGSSACVPPSEGMATKENMKRPAGSSACLRPSEGIAPKEKMKRPAGSLKRLGESAEARAASALKGKKFSSAKKKGKCEAKRSVRGDEYRKRLLATVPSALKRRFKEGCTTCRGRPLCCNSCWHKRGFRV